MPALAVIKSLKTNYPDIKVTFIGSRFGIESQLIPKLGIKYYGISTGKFRRYHKSKILNLIDPTTIYNNIKDFFKFIKGIREAKSIISYENPDVIFTKGGFVSLPVGLAGFLSKIPIVTHESDTVMGLSNRIMSKFATSVCVTFPLKYYPKIKEAKVKVTGNPIREDLLSGKGENYKRINGFDQSRKTILVLGGSQGSRFINESVFEILESILIEHQLIWIAGDRDASQINYRISKLSKEKQKYVKVYGFVTSEIADIYSAADLVISRAGSNVIFELAALSKPAILIPLENMAGNHQDENAKYFSRSGGAYILRQNQTTPKKIFHSIKYLFENPEELVKMSEKIKTLSKPEASSLVAKVIYEIGAKQVEQARERQKKG